MVNTSRLVDQNIDADIDTILLDVLFLGLSRPSLWSNQRAAYQIPCIR